jgi:hypothetical protein
MGGVSTSIGRKIASIAAGILLLIVLSWAKGLFRGTPGMSAPDGPPPPGRLVLKLDGADVEVAGVQAYIDHPDSGAVRLQITAGPQDANLFIEGPLDLNGDGHFNRKDEFPGDIDDVRSCDILKGRALRLKGGEDERIVLPGAGKCEVVEATVTPREYWRPKGYGGTDAWRADIEVRLKVGGTERTVNGTVEGPITHVW